EEALFAEVPAAEYFPGSEPFELLRPVPIPPWTEPPSYSGLSSPGAERASQPESIPPEDATPVRAHRPFVESGIVRIGSLGPPPVIEGFPPLPERKGPPPLPKSTPPEAPAAEALVAESPAPPAPAVESPAPPAPAVESPAPPAPAVEAPAVEAPAFEAPAPKPPAPEPPASEASAPEPAA